MFMVLAKMSPMSRELGMSTSSTFPRSSVERSSSRSPPSSSPSSVPPKKAADGGFGSAAPKKPPLMWKKRGSRMGEGQVEGRKRAKGRDVGSRSHHARVVSKRKPGVIRSRVVTKTLV